MATCSTVSCGICDAQHITKNADSWCPECEEGFCSECLKHHNVSKYTRSHEVISIENYQKLPQAVSKIVNNCPEHNKRYQNYCTKHESLCCPLCISTSHRECVGLLAIEELIKSSKTSTMIENMERSLKDLAINLEKVIKDRKDNLVSIKNRRQKYQNEIKQMRKRINDHLDKLEKTIAEDLNVAEKKIKSETETLLEQMKKKAKTIEELQNTLTAVKTYASDLQTFLTSKMIGMEVDKEENYMQYLRKDDRLKQISLELKIDDKITNILSTVKSFGSISTTKCASFTFKSEKDKQAQFFTAIQPVARPTIEAINLTLNNKFKIPKGTYTTGVRECVGITKGKLILVDFYMTRDTNNRLLILNSDGTFDDEVPYALPPCDVTSIDDNHVAVSFGINPVILIFNTELKTTTRTIYTSLCCYGITHREGTLFFIQDGVGIQALDLKNTTYSNDNRLTIVHDPNITDFSHITIYNDNIYYTNNNTNTVTCCKVTGKSMWQFKDESVLVDPRGIAVDAKLNVYVSSLKNHSIVVISPDGSHGRRILEKENGINNPSALYFDKVRNSLVVANFNGEIFVYNAT